MSETDKNAEAEESYYSTDMEDAPQDYPILLLIPTGEPSEPVEVEQGYWNKETGSWDGEWRNIVEDDGETPTEYAKTEPVGWAEIPEINDAIYKALGLTAPVEEAAAA